MTLHQYKKIVFFGKISDFVSIVVYIIGKWIPTLFLFESKSATIFQGHSFPFSSIFGLFFGWDRSNSNSKHTNEQKWKKKQSVLSIFCKFKEVSKPSESDRIKSSEIVCGTQQLSRDSLGNRYLHRL